MPAESRRRLTILLAAAIFAAGLWHFSRANQPAHEDRTQISVPDHPAQYPPLTVRFIEKNSPQAQVLSDALAHPPRVPIDAPILCHLLLAYQLNTIPLAQLPSGRDAVQILTDEPLAQSRFNQSLLIQTRQGLRYKLISANSPIPQQGESHRDLCLATFAEIGLPLSTPMQTATASFTLRDLLADSTASFDLQEPEIAWTAIAYSLDLPPQNQWLNSDGQRFTFDDLTTELLHRPLDHATCGGAHLLMAMTFILRADTRFHILSPEVRQSLDHHLRATVTAASAAQAPDGSWTIGWDKPSLVHPVAYTSPLFKRLVTGHLLEWLERLPSDMQPNAQVYRSAARWLCANLSHQSTAPPQPSEFCPWTHAVCAVQNLTL